jgi:hypothetical protein
MEAIYSMMGVPPFVTGVRQVRTIEFNTLTPDRSVGGLGTVRGVAETVTLEDPLLVNTVTVKVYITPFVRPVYVTSKGLNIGTVTVDNWFPEASRPATVYNVRGEPPV